MAESEPSIHLPAPGLRNSRPAVMLLSIGALFLLIAAAVLGMVLVKVWRDRSDWWCALPAGLLGAGLVGLIGYTAVRWGLAAAWCDVTIRLPPGRLVVERSRPKGYRFDVPVAEVAGVQVADQFHPSVGWELLLMLEDLRVVRVVCGRTKEDLETVAQRVRSHLGPVREPEPA